MHVEMSNRQQIRGTDSTFTTRCSFFTVLHLHNTSIDRQTSNSHYCRTNISPVHPYALPNLLPYNLAM